MALTIKQQLFVEHYLGGARGNATEAARRAGYRGNDDTLAHVGSDNLAIAEIAALVQQTVDAAGMTKDAILAALAEIVNIPNDRFFNAGRECKATLGDKVRALELLGKYHRMFVERSEVDATQIKRIEIVSIVAVPCAPRPGEIIDGTARETLPPR